MPTENIFDMEHRGPMIDMAVPNEHMLGQSAQKTTPEQTLRSKYNTSTRHPCTISQTVTKSHRGRQARK